MKYYKQRVQGFDFTEQSVSDPIELSEEQVKSEIGCFFRDVFVILSQQPYLRVNEYRYWQE